MWNYVNRGIYRDLTGIILARLALGPARPAEILEQLDLPAERFDMICRAMTTLANRGRIHRTRIVLTGRRGGNVAVIYQLVR
jgi:hypothetical protein